MSMRALEAIRSSQVIVGYSTYIKLLGDLVIGKETIATGMTREIKRTRLAIDSALSGKSVCFISSGDAGVYGMAGLALEMLSADEDAAINIDIIPGIIAATSCASLLGAPLMHDFATISLSDLLTDLELIEKRLELAAKADFVIVIYNPKSKRRTKPLDRAWDILMKHKAPKTPVGIVRNAGRHETSVKITTLQEMLSCDIDMLTTIIVGNSQTYIKGDYMITPRGYSGKSDYLRGVK